MDYDYKKHDIPSGIYRHWKGNLYLMDGLTTNGENRGDPTVTVKYYPLYPTPTPDENPFPHIKGRERTAEDFFKHIEKPAENYSGPRFERICDWEDKSILPGRTVKIEKTQFEPTPTMGTIVELRLENGKILVHCMTEDNVPFSFELPPSTAHILTT